MDCPHAPLRRIASLSGPCLLVLLLAVGCEKSAATPEQIDLAQPAGWDADLAVPVAPDLDPDPDTVVIDLEAKVVQLEVKTGLTSELWTYNGQLPGPTIRAKKGDRLVVRFTNSLPEPTTIHWHGVRVPVEMDGMEPLIQPGETFEYSYVIRDAGTYWYHPHHRSSAQVGYGLYGALIVEDPSDPPLGDDVVLVLSDIGIEADGSLTPGDSDGWFGDYFGREGNTVLVNGRILPTLAARQDVPQRWRLVNAARSRYFKFALPGESTMVRIGGDGGLIDRPEPIETLQLSPGERAELQVMPKGTAGELTLMGLDANRFHLPVPDPPVPLMKLRIAEDAPGKGAKPLPETLRTIEPIDTTGARVQGIDLMEKPGPIGAVLGINGKTMDEAEPLHASINSVEIWEVTNSTPYDHPFHLHGFSFQVLDIDGEAPVRREWKDTVNVQPKQKIRIAIPFDDRPGHWMFHCHILDHAELGMMSVLEVK